MHQRFTDLLFISYGSIGDFLMTLAFLREVHRAFPEFRLEVCATRNSALLRSIASRYPFVRVSSLNSLSFLRAFFFSFKRSVVIMPATFGEVPWKPLLFARIAALRGAVAGFTGLKTVVRYDLPVRFDTRKLFYQNLEQLLQNLGAEGGITPALLLPEDAHALALISKPYIALAPFAGNPKRSLPVSRWKSIMSVLALKYPEHHISILGAPEDEAVAKALGSAHPRAQICTGRPFLQTISFIKHASLFVGVDSGLTHIAGILGQKSVVVGNLSNPTWLPYYNPNATVLVEPRQCRCTGDKGGDCLYVIDGQEQYRCMADVSDERIFAAVQEALAA